MNKKTYVSFDWAMKRLLRDKANFDVLEGFLSTLLNTKITIHRLLEGEGNKDPDDSKYNRVDLEDEQAVPYDLIVVQPFTATDDPTVLGIKPIPRLQERIQELLHKYQAENIDIEDIEYEEADLEEQSLFPNEENNDGTEPEEDIL